MRSLHIIATLVAAVGLLVTVALALTLTLRRGGSDADQPGSRSADPLQPDQGLAGLRFPEFALIDQEGAPQTHALLDGQVTIVDFIFTNCPLACPGMTGRMADMQDDLAGTGVRFASFSLDPASDNPERLKQYASNFSADLTTWSFLTAPPAEGSPSPEADAARREAIWRLVRDGLKFELREDESNIITAHTGAKMPNIIHTVRFILVGPERQVLGLYTFSDPDQMATLERRVRAITGR